MNELNLAWYCVRTVNRNEESAYGNLRALVGIEVFLPRLRFQRPWRDKMRQCIEPLFPCYVFARFLLREQLNQVRFTPGVSSVVHFSSIWPTIPDEVIADLRHRTGDEEVLERPAAFLPAGTEVEILRGPFQGMQAVVSSHLPASRRVQMLLDMLGQKATLEMGIEDLNVPTAYPRVLLA